MALSAVFTLGLKWALPAIALITLLIVSPSGWETSTIFWLILAASVGVVSIGALVLQSERAASWLGRHVEYWNNRFLAGHWKFEEASGMEAQIVNWRDEMVGTLRHIWPAGFGWALGSQTLSFIVLALSMSFVGLTSEEIPFLALFVAFSVGLIASMVPILPQGVGAVEFVYIWILSGEFGSDLANQIAAAAFVHRVFIWFLPMLVGVIPLVMWRRRMKKHPERNPFATTG